MLKKCFRMIIVTALTMVMLTGCIQVDQVNLTEDEQSAIVSYVADLLLKYDRNHQSNLVDTAKARELEARVEAMKKYNSQYPDGGGDAEAENSGADENASSGAETKYSQQGNQNIAQALNLIGFSVDYAGVEICKSYVGDAETGGFALDASSGKQLMVYHFNVTNETAETAICDVLSVYPSFKLIYNGAETKNAMVTLLSNDFSSLETEAAPGEAIDAVVCVEIEEGFETTINATSLMMNYMGEESIIPLSN